VPHDPLIAAVHEDLLAGAERDDDATTVREHLRRRAPLLGAAALDDAVERVLAHVVGLGALDPLLADPAVSEVMVNGPGPVWVERDGVVECTDIVLDGRAIDHVIERVVAPLGLRVDRASPLVDARLPDGSRVNAVVPPLAVDGPCVTIRRFRVRDVALEELAAAPTAALLRAAVQARLNIVVCGGTGAGKTTLLNALAGCIGAEERVVTVEDAAELRLPLPHVVRLEARPANADGVGAIGIRALVRNALRMRPDRIVVGEVRGPEALDMLQAMNTGHEGSLSTCHANGLVDALRRLETMVLMGDVALPLAAIRDQLGAALDLVVHVARLPGGGRRIVAVGEVADAAPGERPTIRTLADAKGLVRALTRPARGVAG
jgi:pilus assembly protein CpaF